MKHVLTIVVSVFFVAAVVSADATDPWAAWPYRLKLRVTTPELADFTGMARVSVNLGPSARADCADVRVLDDKGREQPWRLLSRKASGDLDILFRTVTGVRDYTLIFGAPDAQKPSYGVQWPFGTTLIDDSVPKRAHVHGLWTWARTPALSGAYSHTNPIVDRSNYHGISEIRNVPLYENTQLTQYVMLDAEDPPGQVVLRLVFEERRGAPVWGGKKWLNLYWGASNIRDLPGLALRMGDLPASGSWQKLSVRVEDLLQQANFRWEDGGIPDLFGIEFCTDRGRAWWDATSVASIPARTSIVGLERASEGASPIFVWQSVSAFSTGVTRRVLNEVRFFPAAGENASCRWDFGDGGKSQESRPVHVFEGVESRRVSLIIEGPAGSAQTAVSEIAVLKTGLPALDFAVDLVSCPFIVRADEKALFSLRLEGNVPETMQLELHAVLVDPGGAEIARERTSVAMLPGRKHPTFQSLSLDVGANNLARVNFEMRLEGRLLASRTVTLQSSRSALDKLTVGGDRYLDRSGNPVVVRCEIGEAPDWRRPSVTQGLPVRTLVLGKLPTGEVPFGRRLKEAMESREQGRRSFIVTDAASPAGGGRSMPHEQAVSVSPREVQATDVVIVASAGEMMFAGVPARAGVDAVSVMVDQIRRQSDARVFLLSPPLCPAFEDVARQYTVRLKMVGLEKNVPVIDVYSLLRRLGGEDPELLRIARAADGVLVRRLDERAVDEVIIPAVIDALRNSPGVFRTND